MAVCTHTPSIANLPHPKLSQAVHREECTQCFDNQDLPRGIDLCLSCFNGSCPVLHAPIHVHKFDHPYTLNIRRVPVSGDATSAGGSPSSGAAIGAGTISGRTRNDSEPPAKMAKLAIQEEPSEKDKFRFETTVKCWRCDPVEGLRIPDAICDPKVKSLIDACLSSLSSARQSEVKAWEEEIIPCEHTLALEQNTPKTIAESGLAHCASCDLTANLWLCLTCGNLCCGRKQIGGLEGYGHALGHFEATGHPVSVKLGTITPEGDADIYCYACDDAKQDPNVAAHLSTFGIYTHSLKKTEKSMTELQIEHNLQYDFSVTSKTGEALQPLCGPGLTGLANLGNSCYIASVLQTIFSLSAFQRRYSPSSQPIPDLTHAQECTHTLPAECLECQMRKIADGLLSGRYAIPSPTVSTSASESPNDPSQRPAFQVGLRPTTFKCLIGVNHPEFSTMRQQDAEEFFGHLLSILRRDYKRCGVDLGSEKNVTRIFEFGIEQKLKCGSCGRVRYRIDDVDRIGMGVPAVFLVEEVLEAEGGEEKKKTYRPVSLTSCIDSVLRSEEGLEYTCPAGCGRVVATKSTRFASFPDVLVVHAKKFELVNWVPTKLDIPVILPEGETLVFDDSYTGKGIQPGEVELPSDDNSNATGAGAPPPVNQEFLVNLEAMGFSRVRCEKALRATDNVGLEQAMEWLFAHMDDPDMDIPDAQQQQQEQAGPGNGTKSEPPQGLVSVLIDMGFTDKQAKKALREADLNVERAVEWLFSHPDDTGEEDVAPSTAASSSSTGTSKPIRGSKTVPARYALKAFVSHKGPSVHSGHYVAHVKVPTPDNTQGEWVLFNDEKVVKADKESVNELKRLAYLYVFERVGA
ncbi:hypothetical protein AX15_001905 [Amanita polypyramis BW_CC]|nr:hypothetical protein AX15_001905 [Amanita polypyramis BW_CC]